MSAEPASAPTPEQLADLAEQRALRCPCKRYDDYFRGMPHHPSEHELAQEDHDAKSRAARIQEQAEAIVLAGKLVPVPSASAAPSATTKEILADYRAQLVRNGRAEDTLDFYDKKVSMLLRHLPERAGDIDFDALTKYVDVRLAMWRRAPKLDARGIVVREGVKVRRTTVRKELRSLKPALKLARKSGKYQRVVDDVWPSLDDDYEPGKRVLDPMELVALANRLAPRRLARVAFAVAVGCDPGAVDRARREDVRADFRGARVRGTKNENRDRFAAAPLPELQELLRWAVAHADGTDGLLFTRWANVGGELPKACRAVGIPACTPTDLRRTYATWLRAAGVSVDLIGVAMGHVGKTMVERVYGRLSADGGDLLRLMDEQVSAHGAARRASSQPAAAAPQEVPENDKRFRRRDSNPDKRLQSPEGVEEALAEALRGAVAAQQWELANAIVAELAARRGAP